MKKSSADLHGSDTKTSSIDRILTLELARVTERAAVAAARLRGQGDEKQADQAAVDAMRQELNRLAIDGRVVIGEGERDEAPMLYIGEKVGTKAGPAIDIALDPLECTTLCAKNQANSLSVIAIAERGNLLYAPDVYMEKIAASPAYSAHIHLDASPADNVRAVARAKGVEPHEITVCITDRPRHAAMVAEIRALGAAIKFITDGDVAAVIQTQNPEKYGIDLYMSIGGAPEGVLAAAALRCIGGFLQGRLILDTKEKRARARAMGVRDPQCIYEAADMAKGDVLFAASGVTNGDLLSGVKFAESYIETESLVMRSSSRTVRGIKARHYDMAKFA
ncbi:class II fructose-bisphosphatase [Candidatus Tokpelaia sp.]|uniref:class II fructose-bisphosphatase n=1 Tax=Candidatus Tokpelaia sp. TaxID=2233777 RepID=UPI00123C4BAE|nr:class II fructose-bisphosphatase [Candidatus Tokpelaia sp.]KAA6404820.1 class II fructose-bisphosphatase [Candidatus Tokpelaia sp.]